MVISVFDTVENIVEIETMLFFPQFFSRSVLLRVIKKRSDCGVLGEKKNWYLTKVSSTTYLLFLRDCFDCNVDLYKANVILNEMEFLLLILSILMTTEEAFVDSVDQDQTAQNDLHCPQTDLHCPRFHCFSFFFFILQ